MKFNFNPEYVISYDEKQVLRNFANALQSACDHRNNCEYCPMKSLCETATVPEFVYGILAALDLL